MKNVILELIDLKTSQVDVMVHKQLSTNELKKARTGQVLLNMLNELHKEILYLPDEDEENPLDERSVLPNIKTGLSPEQILYKHLAQENDEWQQAENQDLENEDEDFASIEDETSSLHGDTGIGTVGYILNPTTGQYDKIVKDDTIETGPITDTEELDEFRAQLGFPDSTIEDDTTIETPPEKPVGSDMVEPGWSKKQKEAYDF